MTGFLWLDWSLLSVSLLNTVLLLWLGLTVLLHAERRTWGIGVAGGGLLLGAAFFVSHSAMLGHDLRYATSGLEFWWRVGWVPVVALPLAWYIAILWYVGFWSDDRDTVRQRHRVWLLVCLILAFGIGLLVALGSSLPSYEQVAELRLPGSHKLLQVPLLFVIYPVYAVLCISLSLSALRRPAPSIRAMGDRARERARPWLAATSTVLLIVSLLVAAALAWALVSARERAMYAVYREMAVKVALLDLAISGLISVSVFLLGQAVVSYEIFTGSTLPRRGLARTWWHMAVIGAGFSLAGGASLAVGLRAIYGLLAAGLLITLSGVLLNRRSFAERAQMISRIGPLATSPRLYDSLASARGADSNADATALFAALCENVVGAQVAYLVPLGRMVPLCPAPLTYPGDLACPSVADLVTQTASASTLCVALEPASYGGARWAVPLLGGGGLVGLLMLGDKQDKGLYSEEEIEIARASSERLLDTLAVGETAQRLAVLLRQRISESRVLEGRGRRLLHDQVLPQLHAAILYLSGEGGGEMSQRAVAPLTEAHRQISDLIHTAELAHPQELVQRGFVGALCAFIGSDLRGEFAGIEWDISPDAETTLDQLPPFVVEVLFFAGKELIRNAARHGRGGSTDRAIRLRVSLKVEADLVLSIEDDGVGFRSSAVTSVAATEVAGGQGLRLHSAVLTALGGHMQVTPSAMGGTRGMIVLPISVWSELNA